MHREDAMLYLASVYKRGIFPHFAPDPLYADEILRSLVLSGDRVSKDTRSKALSLLYSPGVGGMDLKESAPSVPRDVGVAAQQQTHLRRMVDEPPTQIPDLQNAHDHGVVSTAKHTLRALDVGPGAAETIVTDVEEYIGTQCDIESDETKARALHAIDSLTDHPSTQFDGSSEVEVLARVWNDEPDKRDLVVHALSSMIENGAPVCHTGKMTRMLDVVKPVLSMAHIREELQHEATRIRDTTLTAGTSQQREEYEVCDSSSLQKKMVDAFDQYVHGLVSRTGVSMTVLQPFCDDVKDAF